MKKVRATEGKCATCTNLTFESHELFRLCSIATVIFLPAIPPRAPSAPLFQDLAGSREDHRGPAASSRRVSRRVSAMISDDRSAEETSGLPLCEAETLPFRSVSAGLTVAKSPSVEAHFPLPDTPASLSCAEISLRSDPLLQGRNT